MNEIQEQAKTYYKKGFWIIGIWVVVNTGIGFFNKYFEIEFLSNKNIVYLHPIFIGLFALFCLMGFWVEIFYKYGDRVKKWFTLQENLGISLLQAVIIFIVILYSSIQVDSFINSYTGIDSQYLPKASYALLVIFVPSLIVILTLFFLTYLFIKESMRSSKVNSWKFLFRNPTLDEKKENDENVYGFARFIGISVFIFALLILDTSLSKDGGIINQVAKNLILSSEYHPKSHCYNPMKNELVATINENYVSVYDQDTEKFTKKVCNHQTL